MAVIDAVSTVTTSSSVLTVANNLRIASIAIAAYDCLITIPSEIQLYKTSSRRSLGFILFVLIRYWSIALFAISGVGFFYHHFSPEACSHFGYLAPVFKVVQVMISQTILGIRAYNIAHRKQWVARALIATFFVGLVFEWVCELHQRFPVQTSGNCVIGTPHPDRVLSAWTFYFVAMIYDTLALSISTYYLLKIQATTISAASKLLKMLLYDGLGYFVALTAVNLVNIVLFRQTNHVIQASGVNLAYATTWIMSQRILIHVREARPQQTEVIVSPPPSFNTSSSAMRSERDLKYTARTDDSLATMLPDVSVNPPTEFDIEVHIDRSILKDSRPIYGDAVGPDGFTSTVPPAQAV